jgi:hypothetical protein
MSDEKAGGISKVWNARTIADIMMGVLFGITYPYLYTLVWPFDIGVIPNIFVRGTIGGIVGGLIGTVVQRMLR